jgi:repressor LexA
MEENHLSVRTLAVKAHIPEGTLYKYVSGERSPSVRNIQKLAQALNLPLNTLLYNPTDEALPEVADELRCRGQEVYPRGPEVFLPIYGHISAGVPCLADQVPDGYASVAAEKVRDDLMSYFILRVQGNSMINAGIVDGGLVLVHCQNSVNDGEIAVVRIDGDEATIKRIFVFGDKVMLRAENPNFADQILSTEQIAIIGRVRSAMADF